MGMQNGTARKMAVPDLTTTVLTQTITGAAFDSRLAGGTNSRLGRRGLSAVAMFVGALIGAFCVLHLSKPAGLAGRAGSCWSRSPSSPDACPGRIRRGTKPSDTGPRSDREGPGGPPAARYTRAGSPSFRRHHVKIVVDYDECASNAVCMGIAPEVFEVRDDGFLYVLNENPGEELREKVRQAANGCPTGAITIVEDE